jgi:hypothetical protein
MIDTSDELIPLARVPKLIRSPSPPHLSTVLRWVFRGVGRERIRLETVKVGGRRFTTVAAIADFIAATSGPPARGHAGRRSEAAVRAEHELDADGVA